MSRVNDWRNIDWAKTRRRYRRVYAQINKSWRRDDRRNAKRLVELAFDSTSTALLAVKKAATENAGRNTPGVDGVCKLTDTQKLELALCLRDMDTAKPYRQTYTLKKDGSSRALSIPCMDTRAQMTLLKLAIEGIADARLHPHLMGARSKAGIFQAFREVVSYLSAGPRFVAVGDIKDFYPSVSWDLAIEALDLPSRLSKRVDGWLCAPTLIGEELQSPSGGLQQGSPIAPLLAHLTLEGLHEYVLGQFPTDRRPLLIVYVDDILILAHSKLDAADALARTKEWLEARGYQLHPEKTSLLNGSGIVSTRQSERGDEHGGFDYLGVRIEQRPVDPLAEHDYEWAEKGIVDHEAHGAHPPLDEPPEYVTVLTARQGGQEEFVAYSGQRQKKKGLDLGALRRFTAGLADVEEADMV